MGQLYRIFIDTKFSISTIFNTPSLTLIASFFMKVYNFDKELVLCTLKMKLTFTYIDYTVYED